VEDDELPVWSFKPNWAAGIREALEWQTDILGVIYEQRRAIRPTPRRYFEFDMIVEDEDRTLLSLFLHRYGASEFMFPLFIDVLRIDGTIPAATVRINFDTTYTEYAPGLAILIGKNAFDYEVVEIISVDAGGVDLAAGTVNAFAGGARLYPLLRGRLEPDQNLQRTLQRVGQATLRFHVTKGNPRTVPAEDPTLYLDEPVLENWPDERDVLDYRFERSAFVVDNGYSIPFVKDEAERAFVTEAYNWFLNGRAAVSDFRDMLYRLKGRQASRWIPTFAQDARLALDAALGAGSIFVNECGLSRVGGPFSGREHIRIEKTDGTASHHQITGIGLVAGGTEQWNITPVLPSGLTPATVKRISFMDKGRLESDRIEILHHTNRLATVRSSFRTIKSGRTAALPIDYPIPIQPMSDTACGPIDTCSPEPEAMEPDGWFFKLIFRFDQGPQTPIRFPGMNIHFMRDTGPQNGASDYFALANTSYASGYVYEGGPTGSPCLGAVFYGWQDVDPENDGPIPGWDGYGEDPFAEGLFDWIWLQHQYASGSFDGPNIGSVYRGRMTVHFQAFGGIAIPLIVQEGSEGPEVGTPLIGTRNLWPEITILRMA
jgi:hypothetical protein